MSRTSALKVLDHAMIATDGVDNCQKFVDILGLGRIFPLFIKTPKPHKKAGPNKRELEGSFLYVSAVVFTCQTSYRCNIQFCCFTHMTWDTGCSQIYFQFPIFYSIGHTYLL